MKGLSCLVGLVLTCGVCSAQDLTNPAPGEASQDVVNVLVWVGGGLFVLFFPFVVAVLRGHQNAVAIGSVCFFLGWTVIGWVVAMIWSLTGNTHAAERRRYRR